MNKKNVLIGVGIVVMVVLCIGIAIFAGSALIIIHKLITQR